MKLFVYANDVCLVLEMSGRESKHTSGGRAGYPPQKMIFLESNIVKLKVVGPLFEI